MRDLQSHSVSEAKDAGATALLLIYEILLEAAERAEKEQQHELD